LDIILSHKVFSGRILTYRATTTIQAKPLQMETKFDGRIIKRRKKCVCLWLPLELDLKLRRLSKGRNSEFISKLIYNYRETEVLPEFVSANEMETKQ